MTNKFERLGINCGSGREPALTNILVSESWILNSASMHVLSLLKPTKGYLRLLKPILTIIFYFYARQIAALPLGVRGFLRLFFVQFVYLVVHKF
jgi:hypothetical protein